MTSQEDVLQDLQQEANGNCWFEEDSTRDDNDDFPIGEYDLTASPSDFNIRTLFDFVESGAIKIPGFQRNYVWDIRRASKLIESLIIGLPVPQIFLYEEGRNRFLVIDGQQRLMSIYYFVKQRFPKEEKRTELRQIFDERGRIPDDILHDDRYFTKFNLELAEKLPERRNKFNGLNYSTLGDYRSAFELRPIRNIIIKQLAPQDKESAKYEIFSRLNSGGVNLTPQEIRLSLYYSDFYSMLYRLNTRPEWRQLLGVPVPDLHLKDLEFLLRGFAMLLRGEQYSPSMVKFLNSFSHEARAFKDERVAALEALFLSFIGSCSELPREAFQSVNKRFSIAIYESVFAAVCTVPHAQGSLVQGKISLESIKALKSDSAFLAASSSRTTDRANVLTRLRRAREIVRLA